MNPRFRVLRYPGRERVSAQLHEKIVGNENESGIEISHYKPLNLIAPDGYFTFEGRKYRGKVWSQKQTHAAGMSELILMQEQKMDGKFGSWQPFLFRNRDPNVSAASLFDLVPRSSVDPSANDRLTRLGFFVSWTFIGILLWILFFDVQIDTTITFFLMVLGFVLAIVTAFYYEMKRKSEDLVFTARLHRVAPSVPISRTFIHPLTGEVLRFFGEVPIIAIDSSKVSFDELRGFTIEEMSEHLTYAKDVNDFKKMAYAAEIMKHNGNGRYEEAKAEVKKRREEILRKYGDQATSSEFSQMLELITVEMQDETMRKKIEEELESQRAEIDYLHSTLSQALIERDKYEKEAQQWMKAANSDVQKFNVTVAAKVSKILKQGALVDLYEPSELPNQKPTNINGVNAALASSLAGFLPFVLLFAIGMVLFNTLKASLQQMGEWASFLYVLIVTVMSIALGIFVFGYTKSRIKDTMHNTSSSRKVVSN